MKKILFTIALAVTAMNINAQLVVDSVGHVGINREYHAKNVKIGKPVTDLKPQGDVIVTNSNVTIKANHVLLDKGTNINLGSNLRIKTSN